MSFKTFVRNFLFPASILSGTIIGAGMFALPYVFAEVGYMLGVLYFVLFAAILSVVHLMYADIILRSGGKPQFAYFAKKYLGDWSFYPAILVGTVGLILVLTIYLVLSVSFVRLVAPVPAEAIVTIFWLMASLAVFVEIRKIAMLELFFTLSTVLIVGVLFYLGVPRLGVFISEKSWVSFSPALFILPFGPILFAFTGRTAIPSIINYFKKTNLSIKALKAVIIWGTMAPIFIYLLFIAGIAGLSGRISSDAVSGLFLPSFAVLLGVGILGLVEIFSTYILVGRSIRDSLVYDLNFSSWSAALLVVALPITLYLSGLQNFFSLVGIVGGIFLAAELLFIVLIWRALNNEGGEQKLIRHLGPKTVFSILVILFGGFLYEIFSLLA